MCEPQAVEQVKAALRDIPGVLDVVETGLGAGARNLTEAEYAAS